MLKTKPRVADRERLPAYAPQLQARHRAHAPELEQIIAALPIEAGERVIDVPCGDAFYSRCLADMVGPAGLIVAVDISIAYLRTARELDRPGGRTPTLVFVEGNVYRLPFADNQFALAWCAQSLLTLERPAQALAELRRIVNAGGHVAILEEDRLHEALLPWPVDLELAIREAERRAWECRNQQYSSPARHSQALLQAAGLVPSRRTTYTIDRRYPLGHDDQTFLEHYFAALRTRVSPFLDTEHARQLDRLTSPDADDYLPHQSNFEMTWQEVLSIGVKA